MSALAAIHDFCGAMGISLGRAPRLPLALRFERSGTLHIEQAFGGINVYVARHVAPHRSGVAASVLRGIHPDRALPFPVKAAFRNGDTLVLLSRIAAEHIDLPTLDGTVRLLTRLADEAEAAS